MKKRYNFTLTDDIYKLLKKMAVETGLKMSTIVEQSIIIFSKK